MAVTVSSQLSTVDACESAAPTWTKVGTVGTLAAIQTSDEEQPPFQGTYCYGFDADIEDGGHYTTFTSTDYSAKTAYIAFACWDAASLEVSVPGGGNNSGLYIIAADSSANVGYWHVGGSDTYSGGWRVFVADLSRTPDTNNGTNPTMSQCTGLGFGVKHLTKIKTAHNCFIDLVRVADSGQGLKITTTASTVATLATIAAAEVTGLFQSIGGFYYTKVPLIFGDTTSGDMEFSDAGEVLVFEDVDVPAGHFGITVEGNAAGTIEFQTGTKSGVRGISGLTIIGNVAYHFTATDTDIDALKLYGTTFNGYSTMAFPVTATGREVLDCVFTGGEEIDVSTCVFTYCSWLNATDGGLASGACKISSTVHQVSYSNFTNCIDAWHMPASGTYPCIGNQFAGNTYDVENSGNATAITIEATASSNISTHRETFPVTPGTTTIDNPVSLIIEIVDADGAAVTETCEVTVVKESDTSILYHAENVTTGTTTYNYTSGAGTTTYINVLNESVYVAKTVNNYNLPASAATLTVQVDEDRTYAT